MVENVTATSAHKTGLAAFPPSRCARVMALADRNPRRAIALARRAVEHVSEEHGPDRAWAHYTLGYVLLRWERLVEAGEQLQRAHDAFVALGLLLPALHARYGVLRVRLLSGSGSDLQDAWTELVDAYSTAGSMLDAGRARMYQSCHLNLLGRPQDALALAEEIVPLFRQQGTLDDQGRLFCIMAASYGDRGALKQAFNLIEQALGCFSQLGACIDIARCLVERAWHLQRQETFALALGDLERARVIFTHTDMTLRLALCEQYLGLLYSRLGRYGDALTATLRARAAFVELGRADITATCDLNIGIIAYYSGLFELALAAYRRAETVYAELGIQRMMLISRRNQALVMRADGRPADALALLAAITPSIEEIGERFELAEIHHDQGLALRDLQQNQEALRQLCLAEMLFNSLGSVAAAAETRLDQGWLYMDQGDLATATECFHAARPLLSERPGHQWRADYGLGRCAELRGQLATAQEYYRQACAMVAQLRRQLVSEHASSGIYKQAQQLHTDAIGLVWRLNDARAILALAEQHRSLVLTRQLCDMPFVFELDLAAEYAVQQANLRMLMATDVSAADLDTAMNAYLEVLLCARHRQSLPDDTMERELDLDVLRGQLSTTYPAGWSILVYVPCGETLIIVVLDSDRLELSATPLDSSLRGYLARASLPRYRQPTYMDLSFLSGQTIRQWEVLATLGTLLIPPSVQSRLHPDHRLLIVAGGILHGLPWAALRLEDAWLIERAIVQTMPGLQLWSTLASRHVTGRAALLLGVSSFGARAPRLPSARPSLDLVEQCWHGPITRLENEAVTRQTLFERAARGELRTYSLVHISTHGQLVADRGMLAHLKLADDDLLYDEAALLNLGGAIVVLVACEGSASEVLPGEEVLSLSRALLAAGARDVIASLWQIYDAAVLPFLKPFYEALDAGMDAPYALATAQRMLIAQEAISAIDGDILSSPLVWASLCVLGAGTPLWSSAGGTPH